MATQFLWPRELNRLQAEMEKLFGRAERPLFVPSLISHQLFEDEDIQTVAAHVPVLSAQVVSNDTRASCYIFHNWAPTAEELGCRAVG